MHIDLKNKNALVCGSSQGIGKACAVAMAKAGANVTLVARNKDRLLKVQNELATESDQKHQYLVADFSDPGALFQKVTAFVTTSGPIHILVNNTGGPPGGPIFSAEINEFEAAFTQHLKCNHLLAQALVPGMKDAGFGRIINVISTSVKQPLTGLGVSNTIRGAVASWAKTMANELGKFGITVNNILPGATSTERLASILRSKAEKMSELSNDKKSGEDSLEMATNMMKAGIPAGRFAEPSEIANVAAFLASDLASYVNGINLPVDGGRTKSL